LRGKAPDRKLYVFMIIVQEDSVVPHACVKVSAHACVKVPGQAVRLLGALP